MKLVIAEKPSVAKAYANVIGAKRRCDGYFEGNGYVVSWCIGHLVELAMPQAYNEKYRKWRKEDLPILPDTWKYQVSQSTRKQFNTLKKLMERPDVTELLCATDAGREGELIFRLVYEQAKCKKSFGRIWLSSMEDKAIRDAFADPRPRKNYDSLYPIPFGSHTRRLQILMAESSFLAFRSVKTEAGLLPASKMHACWKKIFGTQSIIQQRLIQTFCRKRMLNSMIKMATPSW